MAQVHLHVSSFNAGEISPLLNSRFAVEKVGSGCRKLRNFYIHPHGPAFRRPGMEYMGANLSAAAKSSLRGFNFSTSTGAVLEFHPDGLQVWSNGQLVPLVTPVDFPYSETECAEVQIVQVNDVVYIAHPNHAPRRLVRYADNDWRLEDIVYKWPVMGDENARPVDVATPEVTTLKTVITQEWPEFVVGTGGATTMRMIGPGGSTGATKTAKLQRWVSNAWVTIISGLSWTVDNNPGVDGRNLPAGAILRIVTTGPASAAGNAIRVEWPLDLYDLPLDVTQPASLQPATVPAATIWQVVMVCPSSPAPAAGAKLIVEKLVGSTWKTVTTLLPVAGQTALFRGAAFAAETSVRMRWSGRALATGSAKIETLAFPSSEDVTLAVDVENGTNRTLTASKAIFEPGHVGSYWQITHRRDTATAQIIADEPTISAESSPSIRVSGKWDVTTYGTWNATLFLERRVGTSWEIVRSWRSNKDRNVIANGEEDQEVDLRLRVTAGTSAAATGAAVPRFVLEAAEARVSGLVKIVAVGALTAGKATTATVDILVPIHSTDATPIWTEGAWSDVKGYPRTVTLHGQRLWFGGTRAEPMRLWGSVVNDYQNFRRTSLDDASVSFTPAAQQSNPIQWLASYGQDLVIGTGGDEWTLGAEDGVITPVSVKVERRSSYGSTFLPAVLLGENAIFVQRGGAKLRRISPRTDAQAWSAADLTILAEHVARTGIKQMAVMNFPVVILWAVTGDGKLIGLTHEAEQNVFGWHVHETDGVVESVAVVYGVTSDEVWVSVCRGEQRTIERLDLAVFARAFTAPAQLIYLDAAKRLESEEPVGAMEGLDHLEGREVYVLADGSERAPITVFEGRIAVDPPARTVIAGLPFTSELQTMRMEIPLRDGTAQHRQWRVSRVGLYLHDSLGGEVADGDNARFEKLNMRRVATPMDTPPPLLTGEIETAIESASRGGVDVVIRQRSPLPLNIGAITLKGDIYGE